MDGKGHRRMWNNIFLSIIGFSFGLMAAGGVFTVLIAVGLIPRFIGKIHSASHVILYEEMVIAGTVFGCILSEYYKVIIERNIFILDVLQNLKWLQFMILIIFGIFSGIFVGCLAMAIAEMLDSIPIFSRRIQFRKGLTAAIIAVSLGKVAGSLYYFYHSIFEIVSM